MPNPSSSSHRAVGAKTSLARALRPRRYPIWSVGTFTTVSILVVALVALAVFLVGRSSLLVEAERFAMIVAALLYVFLAVGLYRGARVKKGEAIGDFKGVEVSADDWGVQGFDSFPDLASGADDLAGCVVGLLLMIVVGVLLVLLLPILLNVFAFAIFALSLVLFWIFRMALRRAFAMSRRCRGRLGPSLGYAAVFTLMYAGWLFAVLAAARYWMQRGAT